MGVFQRTGDILAANVNDLVDRFEQPDKMLRQALRELDGSTATVQGAVARSIAAQRLLEKQRDEQVAEVDRWSRRATTAVTRDDDRLARRAIAHRLDVERTLARIEQQLALAQQVNGVLRGRLQALRAAQTDARRRLATWLARESVAAAQRQLHVGAGGGYRGGVLARIERLTERLEMSEAEAIALGELESGADDDQTNDFAARERDEAIEAELERLKQTRVS